jgi:excisionase family DNA binding protein
MSSNIRILKACEYCNNEYIAKTTVSRTCSDNCAKRLYKLKQRTTKIEQVILKEEVKKRPKSFLDETELRALQAKEYLTLKEAAILLNISQLTLRRKVLTGKATSRKIGKKHIFERASLASLLT